MPGLWIVDADAARRRLLAELAGAGDDAILGAPGDRALELALSPGVVLLGVGSDPAAELDFVQRLLPATSARGWILLATPRFAPEARRLFDHPALALETWPPDPTALRARIEALLQRRDEPSLGERARREAVESRFATFFCDLPQAELAAALHPRHATLPLLVRGEPGTGRRLFARHRHECGALEGGVFAEIACDALGADAPSALERALAVALEGRVESRPGVTVYLHEVGALPVPLQRTVADWIELAPPAPLAGARRVAWIASARPVAVHDPASVSPAAAPAAAPGASRTGALEPGLALAFAPLEIALPPLRARVGAIPLLVEAFASAHAYALGETPRRFSDEALAKLEAWPFAGNTRELEAVVRRTLLAEPADPVPASALRLQPAARASDALRPGAREADALRPAARASEGLRADAEPTPDGVTSPPRSTPRPFARPRFHAAAPAAAGDRGTSVPPLPESLRELVAALTAHLRGELAPLRDLVGSLSEPGVEDGRRREMRRDAGQYLDQLGALVEQVEAVAQLPAPELVPLDLPALIDGVFEPLRAQAEARKILVLKELDRASPVVYSDRALLTAALCALARFALDELPERGDLFVSSRHVAAGRDGRPAQRVLLRYRAKRDEAAGPELGLALTRWLARPLEARFAIDEKEHGEVLVLLDLPAPALA